MLALKLFLVPFFLGLISLAGKRWGAGIAGWLAGLPVIVGPILFLLALEQGPAFAGDAAKYTLSAVFPVIAFGVAYAWVCRRHAWPVTLLAAYVVWLVAALLLLSIPKELLSIWTAAALALISLVVAPWLFPRISVKPHAAKLPHHELMLRMLAGAALTLAVTTASTAAGSGLSGLLALFPVLSAILAVFTHRNGSADAAITLLSNLARGLFSLAGFCFAVSWLLARTDVATAFLASAAIALVIQAALWRKAPARH